MQRGVVGYTRHEEEEEEANRLCEYQWYFTSSLLILAAFSSYLRYRTVVLIPDILVHEVLLLGYKYICPKRHLARVIRMR